MFFLLKKRIRHDDQKNVVWEQVGIVVADKLTDAINKIGLSEISRHEDEKSALPDVYAQLIDCEGNEFFLDSIEEITRPVN